MIAATNPHVARYEHQSRYNDGKPYYSKKPVIAWDDDGNPLVAGDRRLRRADSWANFVGIDKASEPVVAAVPGGGWRSEYQNDDGSTSSQPIVAWAIRADGLCVPIDEYDAGWFDDPTTVENFVRVYHPDEITQGSGTRDDPCPEPEDHERWFHRNPCCGPCRDCGAEGCWVFNDNIHPQIHTCVAGCQCPPECTVHHQEKP